METTAESIAAEPATLRQDKQDKYAPENLILYRTSLALLKTLAEDGTFTEEEYKGDALLQKKFTVDFLEKKMKPNEGEVPQYYVENSHPAIIEPDEWDHVQAELARRKSLGRAYSGKSVFSAKLVCEDCGGFFGSKV